MQVDAPTGPNDCPANTLVARFTGSTRKNLLSPNDLLVDSEPTDDPTGGRAGMLGPVPDIF